MASIVNDGPRFFPNALRDPVFVRDGVLFGMDPGRDKGIYWAVVDPRRHTMYVWRKDTDDFPTAARHLGASVVTNAPFLLYAGGSTTGGKALVHSWYYLRCAWEALKTAGNYSPLAPFYFSARTTQIARELFGTHAVEGFIFGARQQICENRPDFSRPNAEYFGRTGGRLFSNYSIAHGDPPAMDEAIGGLFRSVAQYAAVDNGTAVWVGTWGLVPLTGAIDPALQESGAEAARAEYVARTPQADGPCDGVLLTAFATMGPAQMAALLAGVRVRDAVRLDGNDSVLMGHHNTMHYGDDMPAPKRAYNKYGYYFLAE